MEEQKIKECISIVIPVYNAAPYLRETIQSVKAQTYPDWELILVDDASTDDSMEILQSYKAENIKVLSMLKNKGPAAARNEGIRRAQGRYLTFLDADDIWDKDKLQKQLNFIKEKQCAFSFTGYEFADETAKRNGKIVSVPEKITYPEALKNTTISTITVMFDRRKLPTELLLMPENCQREDTATWWKILKKIDYAYGLNEILSFYRKNSNGLSSNKIVAFKRSWNLYKNVEKLGLVKSIFYFSLHFVYAIKKRL